MFVCLFVWFAGCEHKPLLLHSDSREQRKLGHVLLLWWPLLDDKFTKLGSPTILENVNWSAPKSCSANYHVCCSISNKPVQLQISEWSDPSSKPVWGTQWRQTWWCGGFRILYSTNSVNFHTIDVSEETSKRWMDGSGGWKPSLLWSDQIKALWSVASACSIRTKLGYVACKKT